MNETENHDPLLTRKEAARYIRNEPQTLANWACTKRYKLNFIKKGRSVLYRRSDLDRFLEQSLVVMSPD